MFPKCFLDVSNIGMLREYTVNIPRILRAGWVISYNITVKFQGGVSKITVPGSLTPAPVLFYIE